jgi:hypothetical protein
MNTENVLLGLILAGTGLCFAYFWAEIARRKQDRTRAESTPRGLPTAVKRASGVALTGHSPQRRAKSPGRQEAA